MKKNVIKGTSICVLLFLVTATNLMAQHICGTVTDMQNQPIGFANIVLLSARDSSFIQGSISQEDGSFEIIAPSPNTYIIKVSYRVGQGHYCPLPPSEPYVRVSPHTAQAFQSLCSCAETGSSYFLFPLFFTG